MTQELIERLRDENLQEDEIRSYAREAAAALERQQAVIDETYRRNVEHCEEIKRLTEEVAQLEETSLWQAKQISEHLDAIERLTAANSALAEEIADYSKENVVLTAERDAAVECAAQEARYNNSLRDELAKNGEHLRYVEGQETLRCAEVRGLTAERDALKEGLDGWHKRYLDCEVERDAYQVAADQQAMAHKIEWDGLSMQVDALKADAARMTKALRSVIASLELGIGETERVHQYCEVPKSLLKECRNAIAKEQA
jgi:hypothetical protein